MEMNNKNNYNKIFGLLNQVNLLIEVMEFMFVII
jgi:hypothetical protein